MLVALCLLVLHTPKGHEVILNVDTITSMRIPGQGDTQGKFVTAEVHCAINTVDGKFVSVIENCAVVMDLIEAQKICKARLP